jgi:UDP:flavonoid glycosyltransferase YjiC (YdhE family)
MSAHNNGPTSRRFLITSTMGLGHLHPMLPGAQALQDAGHEVAFGAPAPLRAVVERAGFAFFPAGGDRERDPEFQQLMAQLGAVPPGPESERIVFGRVFTGVNPRLMAPDVVAICRAWGADMIIRESGEFGAAIAADYLGLPQADVAPAAYLKGVSFFEHDAAQNLDPIRQSWGLAPDPALASLHPYLMIACTPPSFANADLGMPGAYPATARFFRPRFFDQAGGSSLPDWVAALPDQPTVYVTLGTEANHMPGFYPRVLQTIIAGLRDEPLNLIVTVGRDKDPADFGELPANVHIERYIPQSLLLPHCDLLLMHGGSNSLLQAIDLGLPMVIVPLIADQFMNAAASRRLGLAEVVDLDNLTPESVRRAVGATLHDPAYRRNVGRLRDEMHGLPDLSEAVRLLEACASAAHGRKSDGAARREQPLRVR